MIDADKIFRDAVNSPPPPADNEDDDGDHHHHESHTFFLMVAGANIAASTGGTVMLAVGASCTLFTVWTLLSWALSLMAVVGWRDGLVFAGSVALWAAAGYLLPLLVVAAWRKWRQRRVA